MTVNDVLPIILYILGSVLLVALIVLTIKLIATTNKINKLVDNITVKAETLDDAFNLIGMLTGKVSTITDRFVDVLATLIGKIFKGKEEKLNEK